MGKLMQLFGLTDMHKTDEKYLRMNPIQRQAEIDAASQSAEPIGIFSPEEFDVEFRGQVVTIKKGFHQYSPSFAVWALQKYGSHSKYGKTYRTVDDKLVENPEINDEPPADYEAKEGEFVEKPKRAKKAE